MHTISTLSVAKSLTESEEALTHAAAGVAVFLGVADFLGVEDFAFDASEAGFLVTLPFLLAGLDEIAGPFVTLPLLVLPKTFFSSTMAGA